MRFKVPQNVQREDTIIGPLTLRQLLILGVGGGVAYALYVSLSTTYFIEIWLPPVAIVGALTAAFAFLKIHEMPFHIFLMNFLEYHLLPKKRIWIQGSGIPFISPFQSIKPAKKEEKKELKDKKQRDLAEISKKLDIK